MTWREAFLKQAASDNAVRKVLNDAQVAYAHRLHYLQMVTEKLGKGLTTREGDSDPPPMVHAALVKMLQSLKASPNLRRRLGYRDSAVFRSFINSLLDLAGRIESLAPAMAGWSHPNAEYPWLDQASGGVIAPVDFQFPMFDPRNPKMIQMEALLAKLLQLVE